MDTRDKILKLMETNDISAYKLSKDLKISQGSISAWKKGTGNSYTKYIPELANYFNVSTDYLLGTDEKDEKPPSRSNKGLTDDDIKFALFSGSDNITDEMYEEVKQFAEFVKQKYKK